MSYNSGQRHSFHIPVMGIGFTLDTPLRVAHLGLSSCMSLVDDLLIDQVRCYYARQLGDPAEPIPASDPDPRARRIREYLDLVDRETERRTKALKASGFDDPVGIRRYFELLPSSSPIRRGYDRLASVGCASKRRLLEAELRNMVRRGPIEVNIMTKLDRAVDERGELRAPGHSDALAALRGFATSTLQGNLVLSAGVNQRLATYLATFPDFLPDPRGVFQKQVVLKVSDFRSARIQAKLCARRGVWVSEFRVESGLNCGGHAFPTEGVLLGPILEDFKREREVLRLDTFAEYSAALSKLGRPVPARAPAQQVTVQGGIGTAEEHSFLLEWYEVDSAGWGSPFLLVPEVTAVDTKTRAKLAEATLQQIQLGHASPLGVRFWHLTTADSNIERQRRIECGRPGSACPKGYCALHFEFGRVPLCAASRAFQKRALRALPVDLSERERDKLSERILSPCCICHDLGASIKIVHGIESGGHPSVCPGPNLAYFSSELTLEELVDHIYGRRPLRLAAERTHMFLNELKLYLGFFEEQLAEAGTPRTSRLAASLTRFHENLMQGVEYYRALAAAEPSPFDAGQMEALEKLAQRLRGLSVPDVFTACS